MYPVCGQAERCAVTLGGTPRDGDEARRAAAQQVAIAQGAAERHALVGGADHGDRESAAADRDAGHEVVLPAMAVHHVDRVLLQQPR